MAMIFDFLNRWKDKIVCDEGSQIQKSVIANAIGEIARMEPSFQSIMESIQSIQIVNQKETYERLLHSIFDQQQWGELSKENFLKIYSFEKPNGYAIHGLTFVEEGMILINLHQIREVAREYKSYLLSDEFTQRRDYRYFADQFHTECFKDLISDEEEAVQFLFWNALFEQLRTFQQSVQEVDMMTYGYQEESRLDVNDRIGFAKYMYQQVAQNRKAVS